MEALSAVYGAAATWRRRWYAASATRVRRLGRPVISIGNVRVGGSGKTPAVACIARVLLEQGEQPAILSRGYARQTADPGVTIVSDRQRVLADVAHAGDEPLLLARSLPGVPVLVCADRYEAGRVAESRFGATIHLLDDGFQHVRLARDLDLLLADPHDLDDRVLPAGRLREPIANASIAHAVIVPGVTQDQARKVAERLGVRTAFCMTRVLDAPVMLRAGDDALPAGAPVVAAAGIARPERFFNDLDAAGYRVVDRLTFRDHHVFDRRDLEQIASAARTRGAAAVLVTEKDAVRLGGLDLPLPVGAVPMRARIEPAGTFATWLAARIAQARNAEPGRGAGPR